ncbi:MAG TPA: short-chain dehydrogenase/reductase [Solirubrobacterales bacterium]|nr:short-chain dehydrogenase/reductase [Solirubrobacterales bacterium]
MAGAWEISGRVALITGGARGIGLDTARRAARDGMRVALVDIDGELAAREAESIGVDRAVGIAADVTDRDAVERAVAETVARFGGVDALIANAGVSPPPASMLNVDEAEFARTVEIDLHGVWNTVRAGLPEIVERRGYVLVVASIYAAINGVLAAPYAISKAGVEQLGRALRVELAPHGASAGVAYFGFIDTALVRDAFSQPAHAALRAAIPGWVTRPVPVGRAGAAMLRGIERRSARVSAPWWVAWLLALRGLIGPLDRRLARDARVASAIALAEADGKASAER